MKKKHSKRALCSGWAASLSAFALLYGCSEAVAPPSCRISEVSQQTFSGNEFGCNIKLNRQMVALVDDQLLTYQLPFTQQRNNEIPQCTAHRATFETTGLNVRVEHYLGTSDSGIHLFQCQLSEQFPSASGRYEVPDWGPNKFSFVELVDPFLIEYQGWHRPDDLVSIRNVFVANTSSAEPDHSTN